MTFPWKKKFSKVLNIVLFFLETLCVCVCVCVGVCVYTTRNEEKTYWETAVGPPLIAEHCGRGFPQTMISLLLGPGIHSVRTHPVHHFLGSPLCAGLCWQQTQRSRAKIHLSGHFWSDRTRPWREFCFRSSDHCLPWCTQHLGAGAPEGRGTRGQGHPRAGALIKRLSSD